MKRRVLVVDDSPQNRLVATGHLEAAGYEVLEATDGEQALDVLGRETVDLVILDVLMPGIGGFETCRRIRATPALGELPVLFLTALGDREATAPALEAGGDDLLGKPFQRAELLLRARALIRQRQTTAKLAKALRALVEQNEALRRAEHDKRRISELIVHDLKSPLAAVLANAELLKRAARGEPPDKIDMLDDILLAAQQIERTAKDLLDVSHADAGELAARCERFALGELIDEVVATMRGLARWTEIDLQLEVRADQVVADRELTRRMLQNLVHNAVKHAPKRSVVRLDAALDGDGLLVRVIDQGPGLTAAEAERIFDRYVRLAGEPMRSGSHGLGLAFCRLAAEVQGGRIWVERGRERGAAFCVRIPQPAA